MRGNALRCTERFACVLLLLMAVPACREGALNAPRGQVSALPSPRVSGVASTCDVASYEAFLATRSLEKPEDVVAAADRALQDLRGKEVACVDPIVDRFLGFHFRFLRTLNAKEEIQNLHPGVAPKRLKAIQGSLEKVGADLFLGKQMGDARVRPDTRWMKRKLNPVLTPAWKTFFELASHDWRLDRPSLETWKTRVLEWSAFAADYPGHSHADEARGRARDSLSVLLGEPWKPGRNGDVFRPDLKAALERLGVGARNPEVKAEIARFLQTLRERKFQRDQAAEAALKALSGALPRHLGIS